MNYIYNIYLNFNKVYYDYYEWNDKDNIKLIKKIPIIKTNTKDFKKIISNYIRINNKLNIKNYFIITDSKNAYAIKIDKEGYTKEISSFNFDDEYNILKFSKTIKDTNMEYSIISSRNYILDTRKEQYIKKYLLKKIKNISIDTLKYIYYDIYNIQSNDYKYMKNRLITDIKNNSINNTHIFNTLNPISTN